MKKHIFPYAVFLASLLFSCGGENTTTANTTNDVTTTNPDSTQTDTTQESTTTSAQASESESEKTPSPFVGLDSEETLMLYHEAFEVGVNYDSDNKSYTVAICDYSLGEEILGYGATLSEDTYSLSFKGVKNSYFFTLGDKGEYTISFDPDNENYSLKAGNEDHALNPEKGERLYFLHPYFVGIWDVKEKEEDDALFIATITNNNFNPVIEIKQDGVTFTTTLTHSELGTKAVLTGEKDSALLHVGDEITFLRDDDNNKTVVTYKEKEYTIFTHVDKSYEYVEGYFAFANLANGSMFKNGDLSLTMKNPMGDIRRWVMMMEGTFSQEAIWAYEQNQAILSYTCNIKDKTGLLKNGVTYKLAAIKDGEETKVHLFGSDDSDLTMEVVKA